MAVRVQGKDRDPKGLNFKMPDLSEKTTLGKRIKIAAQGLDEKEIVNICVGSSPMSDSFSSNQRIEPIPEHLNVQLQRVYDINIEQFTNPDSER